MVEDFKAVILLLPLVLNCFGALAKILQAKCNVNYGHQMIASATQIGSLKNSQIREQKQSQNH